MFIDDNIVFILDKTLMLLFKGAKNAQNGKNPAENKSAQLKVILYVCYCSLNVT